MLYYFFACGGFLGLTLVGLAFLGGLTALFSPVECLLLLSSGGIMCFAASFGLEALADE